MDGGDIGVRGRSTEDRVRAVEAGDRGGRHCVMRFCKGCEVIKVGLVVIDDQSYTVRWNWGYQMALTSIIYLSLSSPDQ